MLTCTPPVNWFDWAPKSKDIQKMTHFPLSKRKVNDPLYTYYRSSLLTWVITYVQSVKWRDWTLQGRFPQKVLSVWCIFSSRPRERRKGSFLLASSQEKRGDEIIQVVRYLCQEIWRYERSMWQNLSEENHYLKWSKRKANILEASPFNIKMVTEKYPIIVFGKVLNWFYFLLLIYSLRLNKVSSCRLLYCSDAKNFCLVEQIVLKIYGLLSINQFYI